MYTNVVYFFDHSFFSVIGAIYTLISICGFLYVLVLVIKGVIPVWYRLGIGLSKSKVAIFAVGDELVSLESMLVDSKLFREKNIMPIPKNNIKRAKKAKIFLFHWEGFHEKLDHVLSIKDPSTALIVYSTERNIDKEDLQKINDQINSTVVNFRGRLMQDIVIALITTSYER